MHVDSVKRGFIPKFHCILRGENHCFFQWTMIDGLVSEDVHTDAYTFDGYGALIVFTCVYAHARDL